MKKLFVIIFYIFSFIAKGQIMVIDAGDGWKSKVDSAISIIQKYDSNAYGNLINYCKEIGYWNGDFSTTEEGSKIIISRKEMNHISVNNIACILVHESRHLMIEKADPKWDENFIEFMCYDYELNFAKKIPNMENWVLQHITSMREKYVKIIQR